MILAWREFLRLVDPDVITGFNITNIDFPYLIQRSEVMGMREFAKFTRINSTLSKIKDTIF